MTGILRYAILAAFCLQAGDIALVEAAKQQVQLSDSYLPVAMQVIAHLTDQMAFEVKDEPGTKPPTTKPTMAKPTTTKPPQSKPTTTAKPLYVTSDYFETLQHSSVGWWMPFGITSDITTPFHRPGYYAPASPPKPSERVTGKQQQYNFPQQDQQYNAPTQNQQYNSLTQIQQYDAPTQNQQYNTQTQNQQYTTQTQNQQYNTQTQNQQYNTQTQNQQYNTQTQNQQYNTQPQNQQYNAPTANEPTNYAPQQNQQIYVPLVSIQQQSSDFIQNNPDFNSTQYQFQQPYNIPSYNPQNNQDTQQFYIPPGTLQPQSIPPQNQQYGFTQNNQQLNNSQNLYQYNPFLQNQQQYSQNQYGVMTFDFPQYNPIQPQNVRNEDPLLSAHHEEVKPLLEPTPESPQLLPPHFEADVDKISSRSKGFDEDELTEENLQYLSQNVREMIRMANDPYDERLIDVWDGLRAHPAEPTPKGKLSASNLRLLLLYDLLSREAKRQRLSDYSGFSPDVMKTLVESSGGGARAQLSMALSKMVERHDCAHEYANNRAKEMVAELAKDESKLSSEIRYLQPLVYKY